MPSKLSKSLPRYLTALPVYNEVNHVESVLDAVSQYSPNLLVVDDGSTDGTSDVLKSLCGKNPDLHIIRHRVNEGYGAAIRTSFQYAMKAEFEVLATIDCDGQHQPELIPELVSATAYADIVSGSRYLQPFAENSKPPADRQHINAEITGILNHVLDLELTDSFCGFKAYRVNALKQMRLAENGYAIPLEFWVQVARNKLSVREYPVPLVYLDEERSFGGSLDDASRRRNHYLDVLRAALGDPHKLAEDSSLLQSLEAYLVPVSNAC